MIALVLCIILKPTGNCKYLKKKEFDNNKFAAIIA